MLIGIDLLANSLAFSKPIAMLSPDPPCDGLNVAGPVTCSYVKGINNMAANMDMTKYKVYLSISGFSAISASTTTVLPYAATPIQSKF